MVYFRGLILHRFCEEVLRIPSKHGGTNILRDVDLEGEEGPLIPSHQFKTSPLQISKELVCDESKNPEARSSEALE
jgi:hypothetical protein